MFPLAEFLLHHTMVGFARVTLALNTLDFLPNTKKKMKGENVLNRYFEFYFLKVNDFREPSINLTKKK
jgi:hypothetical protein